MAASVLVVEDERKIRDLLRSYLEHDGLDVITTDSGAEAIRLAREAAPDLIVLDLMLPDVPGEEVAREVRAASATPIMMLTAKTGTEDRIHGLELGADDYVTKPFSPREVLLRARAILRRGAGAAELEAPVSYGGGRLVIDEAHRQVTAGGQAVTLTATEWSRPRTGTRRGGGSAAPEQLAQHAALGCGVVSVAGAPPGGRDAGQHLVDVLAAAGPGDLAAFLAGDWSAHAWFSSWVGCVTRAKWLAGQVVSAASPAMTGRPACRALPNASSMATGRRPAASRNDAAIEAR